MVAALGKTFSSTCPMSNFSRSAGRHSMSSPSSHCSYDVCLSYAGEDRDYVQEVATHLRAFGIRVFYDIYEEVSLWGIDLQQRFADIYQHSSRYCVMFVSQHYKDKVWPNHESANAFARALRDKDYLLPVRFDDTEIPGLLPTLRYVDANTRTTEELAKMIKERTTPSQRKHYFPSVPDRLFASLGVGDDDDEPVEAPAARAFFDALELLNPTERLVVFSFFVRGCPAELPDNVHISKDYLARVTNKSVEDVRQLLGELRSLGFFTKERRDNEHDEYLGESEVFVLEWHDMRVDAGLGNATDVARKIVDLVAESFCEEHAKETLMRLDFSRLEGS